MNHPATSLPPGSLVEGYRIASQLGQGGMGTVYRATHVASGRAVALKLLHGRPNPTQLERFRREADVTASLQHPGIVAVYASGHLGGRPFIAYGLVEDAQHLDDAFRALDLDARVELVLQAARALAFAHERGIVHRDVKPENLLVDPHGQVRVGDFGLARVDDGRDLTHTGAVFGTPSHMAPEQFDDGVVGAPADVWALGVILFQTLTLELPFHGDAEVRELAPSFARSASGVSRCRHTSRSTSGCQSSGRAATASSTRRSAAASSWTAQAVSTAVAELQPRRLLSAGAGSIPEKRCGARPSRPG